MKNYSPLRRCAGSLMAICLLSATFSIEVAKVKAQPLAQPFHHLSESLKRDLQTALDHPDNQVKLEITSAEPDLANNLLRITASNLGDFFDGNITSIPQGAEARHETP